MIQLKGVSKRYGDHTVLHSLDLRLEAGKTHVILGQSGCGKSTLLRILTGLVLPSEGEAWIDGNRVTPHNQRHIASSIGYVIQEGGLFPHLTAADNVALVARTLRWSEDRIRARLSELETLVGFDDGLINRYPRQLSGGQRQRVGLMRAMMLDPELLLLDEPLGALDPIVRAELQDQLKEIFNRVGKTVVIVTHDIGEAAFFGHTITLLKEGGIVQHGDYESFVRKPADSFVTAFLRSYRAPPEVSV